MANQRNVQPMMSESDLQPKPEIIRPDYRASARLENKVALITGGDSGIGRSVAVHFAREGADVAIVYLSEHRDAEKTCAMVEAEGRRCVAFALDVGYAENCRNAVQNTIDAFGRLDILVNNAGQQHSETDLTKITPEQIESIFRTNIFAYFYMVQAALPHLKDGSSIINTTSVTAYAGSSHLMDYAATKGAIVAFTRSLSQNFVKRNIRVNGVAPGPIWTPLIPSSFPGEKIEQFGKNYPMGRPGQPSEVAPSYVFLASADASYMSGQVLHPNGGEIVQS